MYESDCIFDKFHCSISGDGRQVATGTYSNQLKMVCQGEGGWPHKTELNLEASRDPMKKRHIMPKVRLPHGIGGRGGGGSPP